MAIRWYASLVVIYSKVVQLLLRGFYLDYLERITNFTAIQAQNVCLCIYLSQIDFGLFLCCGAVKYSIAGETGTKGCKGLKSLKHPASCPSDDRTKFRKFQNLYLFNTRHRHRHRHRLYLFRQESSHDNDIKNNECQGDPGESTRDR